MSEDGAADSEDYELQLALAMSMAEVRGLVLKEASTGAPSRAR